jgi:hypothetical protein
MVLKLEAQGWNNPYLGRVGMVLPREKILKMTMLTKQFKH